MRRARNSGLMVACALFLLGSSLECSGAIASKWRWSNPKPHGNNIVDLALQPDHNLVWQVGDQGRIYTSSELDNWFPRESGTMQSLRAIAFFDEQVFISGEEGTIVHGPSPEQLQVLTLPTTDWLEGIAASPDAIVTVGDNGTIFSSADGLDWTPRGDFTTWLRNVTFANGFFVTVGENGFMAVSPDGIDWTTRSLPTTANLNRVAYVNNNFWVLGDGGVVLTNGVRGEYGHVNIGATNDLYAIAASTNEIVIAGDQVVFVQDLSTGTWSAVADATNRFSPPIWPYYSALWDGRLFLLGGRTGLKVEGFRTNATSELVWMNDFQPTRNWLWSLWKTPQTFVASGTEGTIVTSEDGAEWSREVVPASVLDETFLGVGGSSDLLIAAGTDGALIYSQNIVSNVLSTNAMNQVVTNEVSLLGVIWNEVEPSPAAVDLQGIAERNGTYIVTGANGTILTSGNGSNWTARASRVSTFLSGAAGWELGFVVVGDMGTILSSPNGADWQARDAGVTNWVYSVRYVGGRFIAVGEAGLILTSDDGAQWNERSSGTTKWLNDSTFINNTWYVVGTGGIILSSADSLTWTLNETATSRSLYGVSAGNDQMVTVGMDGVILRQKLFPELSPIEIHSFSRTDGMTAFLFTGELDQRFHLESTAELDGSWDISDTLEILSPAGTLIYQTDRFTLPMQFFRTQLLP